MVGNEFHFPAVGSLIGFSQTPQDRQNFLYDLIVASFVSGRQLHQESVDEREIEKERGGGGRELVSERSCVSTALSLRSILTSTQA